MNRKTKAICYILCSAFCFAMMNTFVRLSGDLPFLQKSFFRNAIALLFASVVLARTPEKFRFDKGNLPLLLVRASAGTVGLLCNFYAVDHLLLSDASLLNKLSPFFAILFSFLLLKERLNLIQGLSVLAAFVGALFIIKPTLDFQVVFPYLIGLLGGMGAGLAYTAVRRLSQRGERGPFIVFFFSLFSCLVTLPPFLLNYRPMSLLQLGCLILAGLCAAGGQFSITAAYSNAPARDISIFDYTQVLFSALLGFLFFQQVPDGWSVIGYVIICAVSIGMFQYNRTHN